MVFSPTTLHDSVKDRGTNAGEGLAESDDCHEICAQRSAVPDGVCLRPGAGARERKSDGETCQGVATRSLHMTVFTLRVIDRSTVDKVLSTHAKPTERLKPAPAPASPTVVRAQATRRRESAIPGDRAESLPRYVLAGTDREQQAAPPGQRRSARAGLQSCRRLTKVRRRRWLLDGRGVRLDPPRLPPLRSA
jgi:hypothetical protein